MRRPRTETLLIAIGVLLLTAGVVAGMLVTRLPPGTRVVPAEPAVVIGGSPLMEQLQLTAAQREQMRVIWEAVRADVESSYQEAQSLQKQREEALVALLDDAKKAEFQRTSQAYADKYDSLMARRDRSFEAAVARTRGLLNEMQRQKYEAILKTRLKRVPAKTEADNEPTKKPDGASRGG
jgi:Spy/CpxP family protein refolding chaperone